jgi:alkaline phosphatase D
MFEVKVHSLSTRTRLLSFWLRRLLLFVFLANAGNVHLRAQGTEAVHMANGIKIGEVTATSAIIWTRLTRFPERNIAGTPFPTNVNDQRRSLDFDNLAEMEGSVPGAPGEVSVSCWPAQDRTRQWSTEWQAVDVSKDFTCQIQITDLLPGTEYSVVATGRPAGLADITCMVAGAFVTAPAADTPARVRFTVVTGQEYPRRDDPTNGHKIYPTMRRLGLSFFVHTGDIEYYDKPGPYADNVELARFKWNRIYAMPYQRAFHNRTASYFIKDDHDTLKNDSWPGQTYGDLTWEQGLELFREQVPMGEKTCRTIRWGKDLQIWLVEGRDFRSPNDMPDGPEKTIWGAEQKQWFFDSVRASDATFRILISPTPIVGPDRGNKNDNHANAGFKHEGDELRVFIGQQKDMFVICGDRHWQYVSVDSVTGVREYSCGPTSDAHAGGFREENRTARHRYLKIKGGFLFVEVDRVNGVPTITFRHYGVDGSIYNEDIFSAAKQE